MSSDNPPRLMIAGTGGDSGKTFVALGLASHWRREGLTVQPFKKGPDYIDPAWLTLAAGRPTRNLDTWMMGRYRVVQAFVKHSIADGVNLIEANRGLYDGEDKDGSHSSAVLAKLLATPVVLVLPVAKMTRTAAALVLGLKTLDPEVNIAGIVLNQVAGSRHQGVVRRAVEDATGISVIGAVLRLRRDPLPGRHLGLVTPAEHEYAGSAVQAAEKIVADSVDTKKLLEIAHSTEPLPTQTPEARINTKFDGRGVRIAYFTGSAFTFYYPDNLEALEQAGAKLVPVNPLEAAELPECDALYIGGGFPETHAAMLSENEGFRRSVANAADTHLPIWAECGGLMFLSRGIIWRGKSYPMAGVLAVDVKVNDRPQGHGYEEVVVNSGNAFLNKGAKFRGHEFHYSQIEPAENLKTAFHVNRGVGVGQGRDGIVYRNVVASYLHLHAIASPEWVEGMITAALSYKNRK